MLWFNFNFGSTFFKPVYFFSKVVYSFQIQANPKVSSSVLGVNHIPKKKKRKKMKKKKKKKKKKHICGSLM